tara:strand:- start:1484 stop:2464 length:981 start_codon:yes stop_codon:yes gene_type:complete
MNQVNKDIVPVSVAPMMDWTDRHCRFFHRLISPSAMLYTEMKTTGALLHGDKNRFLQFSEQEQPVALQLGGSDPKDLATSAKMGEHYGYNEINLNCGCPSDRVQKGKIGAILMEEPNLVADSVGAMIERVDIPVTVKCRIGIDTQDDFAFLNDFVTALKNVGCKTIIIHARKAWLQGLSPKENRTKPPINYARVAEIKAAHPDLMIGVNGEIKTAEDTQTHLKTFDSVMIGREAYQNPYILSELETVIFKNAAVKSREEIAREMIPYIEQQMKDFGTPLKSITRHMIGLYHQCSGAKKWRQVLSTLPHEDGAQPADVIEKALSSVI